MKITGTIWLEKIVDKLAYKHHLTQDEVEQVLANYPKYRFLENGKIDGEDVYSAYGCTNAGRYVTIIFIRKFRNRALIVTARDMDEKERRQYGK
ncbi:MAG: BrnT family toxin [Candidatus Schekmanbacteria bacterium]|nr:BrnT family toxin [Candidatus Schekmanbacteria bacterium]